MLVSAHQASLPPSADNVYFPLGNLPPYALMGLSVKASPDQRVGLKCGSQEFNPLVTQKLQATGTHPICRALRKLPHVTASNI